MYKCKYKTAERNKELVENINPTDKPLVRLRKREKRFKLIKSEIKGAVYMALFDATTASGSR